MRVFSVGRGTLWPWLVAVAVVLVSLTGVAQHSITNISFSPRSPATLGFWDKVNVGFDYETTHGAPVLIFAQPMTDGQPTPNTVSSGSQHLPSGRHSGNVWFSVMRDRETVVDQVRFRMWDVGQNNLLYEAFVSVRYTFREVIEPQSRTVLYARVTSAGAAFQSPDVAEVTRTGTGEYRVRFRQPISNYSLVATSSTGRTSPRMIETIAGVRFNHTWTDLVVVRVFDPAGNRTDGSFDLIAVGPDMTEPRTVLTANVTSAGASHRSPDVADVTRTATGTYRVRFRQPVNRHALIATSTTARTSPQTVTTVAGVRADHTWTDIVIVYVFNASGNLQDGSFRLTAVGSAASTTARTVLYARVTSAGAAYQSPDVAHVTRTATGTYRVRFRQPIASYAQLATSGPARMITTISGVRSDHTWTDTVIVHIFDSAGNLTNTGFDLIVVSPS